MSRAVLAALLCVCALAVGPIAAAQELKVLKVARDGQFTSLDPPRHFDSASAPLVQMAYSALVRYSHLARPYRLEPDLLAQMPAVSADGRTYSFTLRQGVRFHDCTCFAGGAGRELTSDDVIYSFKRFADANINVKSWSLLDGSIEGLNEFRAATQKAGAAADYAKLDIAGLKKTGSHTFTITLTAANPRFVQLLAIPPLSIVPAEAVRAFGDEFGVRPIGTGPFTLDKAERKGTLRFLKYARYHVRYPSTGMPGDAEAGRLADAGKPLPLVDVVEMPLIEEPQPRVLSFLNGDFDLVFLDRAHFTKMIERSAAGVLQLKPEYGGKYVAHHAPTLSVSYLAMNLRDPLLGANKPLRHALAHLVDAKGLIDAVQAGRNTPARSLIPDGLYADSQATGAKARAYDVAEAKRLLAAAGHADGKGLPPLTVLFGASNERTRTLFDFLRLRFAAAGVVLKPEYQDYPTYVKQADAGKFHLVWSSWYADYPDPESSISYLQSKNIGGGWNHAGFNNAAFDRAHAAARAAADGPERLALFKQMNGLIFEEVPLVPVAQGVDVVLTQKWIGNYKLNPMIDYLGNLQYLDVDIAAKKKGL